MVNAIRREDGLRVRRHDGHTIDWDGNNMVGRLDDDAQEASEEFERLIETSLYSDNDCVSVWAVCDWLFSTCTLRDHWDTQPLSEAVATLEADAESEGVYLDGDVEGELLDDAADRFDRKPKTLNRVHVDALLADGRITAEAAAEWIAEYQPA